MNKSDFERSSCSKLLHLKTCFGSFPCTLLRKVASNSDNGAKSSRMANHLISVVTINAW